MAIGNWKLMHECFPEHSHMGTARMKHYKETDEEGKNRGLSLERSKVGTKKRSPNDLTLRQSKYNNNKHNMVIFHEK